MDNVEIGRYINGRSRIKVTCPSDIGRTFFKWTVYNIELSPRVKNDPRILRADFNFIGPSTFNYWTVHFLSYWIVHFNQGPSNFRTLYRPILPSWTFHFPLRPFTFTSTVRTIHIERTTNSRTVHFLKSSNTANRWTLP